MVDPLQENSFAIPYDDALAFIHWTLEITSSYYAENNIAGIILISFTLKNRGRYPLSYGPSDHCPLDDEISLSTRVQAHEIRDRSIRWNILRDLYKGFCLGFNFHASYDVIMEIALRRGISIPH